jgi:lipid-A-disaccharide synthase-like uncharacterized protein
VPTLVRSACARAALLALLLGAPAGAQAGAPSAAEPPEPPSLESQPLKIKPLEVKIRPMGVARVSLAPAPGGGGYLYRVVWRDGRREELSPAEFADLLYTGHRGRSRAFTFLNITSPIGIAWVGLGLLGQLLFAGRMVVQWLASERRRRSVVPVAFWWMSLGGATLLIVYFVWRKDAVGVLGQATGWLIYLRNLRLIYRTGPAEVPGLVR